jgi:hypothetical protein
MCVTPLPSPLLPLLFEATPPPFLCLSHALNAVAAMFLRGSVYLPHQQPTPSARLFHTRARRHFPAHTPSPSVSSSPSPSQDITKMLMATMHLGTKNTDHQMRRYIFKRRADTSINIIDLHKTWEKMQLAARVLVAIENPKVRH